MKLKKADLLLLLVALIWGGNFGVTKSALEYIDSLSFIALRFALAVPSMVLILAFHVRNKSLQAAFWPDGGFKGQDMIRFVLLGLLLVGDLLFFVKGLEYTTTANASIIYTSTPVFVAAISWGKGKKPSLLSVIGLLIALAGVSLVIGGTAGWRAYQILQTETFKGDLIIVLGVLCWAFYTYHSSSILEKYSVIRAISYVTCIGFVFILPFCIPSLNSLDIRRLSLPVWGALIYGALFSTVLCSIIWYYAISQIGPLRVILYQYLIPVIAVLLAFLVWKETISALHVLGICLVLAGVSLARLEEDRKSESQLPNPQPPSV